MNTCYHQELTREEVHQFCADEGYTDYATHKIVLYYESQATWTQAINVMMEERVFCTLKKIVASATDTGKYVIEAYLNA